jgi:pimeloyl-ACP methyl ester carboxylesterase
MPKIKINDITMYYEMHGEGEPLVLVSGFGADHLGWTPVLDAFAKDYQVILFNNRGIGQTDIPEGDYSIEQMADDIFSLCAALNIKNAHFIGNSMGGHLVQMLAYRYPTLVKSLVISNSAVSIKSVFHVYLSAQLELMKANAPVEALMKAMISWAFSSYYLSQPGKLDELIRLGKNNPHPFTITGYEGQLAALHAFDSSGWLEKIKVRTLVLTGDQDIILFPALSKQLAADIPNAQFYCFENCGHIPHIEYPQEYVRIVKKFLN